MKENRETSSWKIWGDPALPKEVTECTILIAAEGGRPSRKYEEEKYIKIITKKEEEYENLEGPRK